MPATTEKDLAKAIKDMAFSPVYIFCGEEDYLKRVYLERLIHAAVTDFAEINLHRLDSSASIDDILAAADAIPMMSEYSVVVVNDYPFTSVSEVSQKLMLAALEQPNERCVLIFLYGASLPKPKSDSGKALLNALNKQAVTVRFDRKTEKELADALSHRASRRSINLQPTVARAIVERCGDNLENLLNEVDKLCDYVGSGAAVTVKDVELICTRTAEATSFALADAVCVGNSDKAMAICADLFELRTEPSYIIGVLTSVFVDIYRVKLGEAEGMKTAALAEQFGYGKSEFKLRRAAQSGKRLSQRSVQKALEIIRSADITLKSSPIDPRIAIERAIVELVRVVTGAQL